MKRDKRRRERRRQESGTRNQTRVSGGGGHLPSPCSLESRQTRLLPSRFLMFSLAGATHPPHYAPCTKGPAIVASACTTTAEDPDSCAGLGDFTIKGFIAKPSFEPRPARRHFPPLIIIISFLPPPRTTISCPQCDGYSALSRSPFSSQC